MKNRCIFFILSLQSSMMSVTHAQAVYHNNSNTSDCYNEFIFDERNKIAKGVIVQEAIGTDIRSFARSNKLYNSDLFSDYNFLFINTLNQGRTDHLDCIDVGIRSVANTSSINTTAFYYLLNTSTKGNPSNSLQNSKYIFNIVQVSDSDYSSLKTNLDTFTKERQYKVVETDISLSNRFEQRMANYKKNMDIGLYYSPIFLSGNKLSLSYSSFGTYGLSLKKNVGFRHAVKLNIGGALKKPDQSVIQSSLKSKMMSAIQNDEDSIYIDELLSGHVYFGAEITYRYSFNSHKAFRPYFELGIGSSVFTSISGRIQDTIDISDVDMSNPSSIQDKIGNPDESSGNIVNSTKQYLTPMIDVGFEYRMSPGVKFNASIPFRNFVDKSGTSDNTFSFGLNFSLMFTMNPGRLPKFKTSE
jgi:hypothetical protein